MHPNMHPKSFAKHLQHDNIVAAIRDTEHKTTGRGRVVVTHKHVDDAVAAAQAEFLRLGMNQSAERNNVLISWLRVSTNLPSSAMKPFTRNAGMNSGGSRPTP